MGGSFKPSAPQDQPMPESPTKDDKAVTEAEAEERERIRRLKGRSSTILTSNLGPATVSKTLLGGGA